MMINSAACFVSKIIIFRVASAYQRMYSLINELIKLESKPPEVFTTSANMQVVLKVHADKERLLYFTDNRRKGRYSINKGQEVALKQRSPAWI